MHCLRRRAIALIAIYALVLQALFTAVAASSAAAGGTLICKSTASDAGGTFPDHGPSCLSCSICGHAAAPSRRDVAITWSLDKHGMAQALAAAMSVPEQYRPQIARAPPAA